MFKKYASLSIVETIPHDRLTHPVRDRWTKLATQLELDPSKFIYTRERAVSAYDLYGLNGNYDGWTDDELIRSYATFRNVPRFVDHDNTDVERATGMVIDAVYHPIQGKTGGWVETVSARDKEKLAQVRLYHLPGCPTLLDAIMGGQVTDTSMGCYVDKSVCTVCGNLAYDPAGYCDHVAFHKGSSLRIGAKSPLLRFGHNTGDMALCGELNYEVTFFELSDITTQAAYGGGGADPDAKVLERIATKTKPAGWESFIVLRTPSSQSTRKAHERPGATTERADINAPIHQSEYRMKDKTAESTYMEQERTAVKPGQEDYPTEGASDKDSALYEQSKKPSSSDDTPTILPSERISQEPQSKDHPLTAGSKKEGEFLDSSSDPSNLLGGKPANVLQEEQEQEKSKFQKTKTKMSPEDAEDAGEELADDQEEERLEQKMSSLVSFIPKNEDTAERIDEFASLIRQAKKLREHAKTLSSAGWRKKYEARIETKLARASTLVAELAKFAYGNEVGSGSALQQQAVDAEGYDVGANSKLNEQSRKGSERGPETNTMTPGSVAQSEQGDYAPSSTPGKAANRIRLTAADADAAADTIVKLMMENRMSYEDAMGQALSLHAAKNTGDVELPDLPGTVNTSPKKKKKVDLTISDDDLEEDVPMPPVKQASDLSSDPEDAASDEVEMKEQRDTLESPSTQSVVDSGTELVQAKRLSPSRQAMLRRAVGEDAETRLTNGTGPTKASPSSSGLANEENTIQARELSVETKGQSSAPEAPVLSFKRPEEILVRRVASLRNEVEKLRRTNANLRDQNERLYGRSEAIKTAWKREQCQKLAHDMYRKGMFARDPKGEVLPVNKQKEASYAYIDELMRRPLREIEAEIKVVSRVPSQRVLPEFKRTVEMPREGTVKKANASPSNTPSGFGGDLTPDFFDD